MGGTEHLTVRREGATLVLTLDRPEARNALSLPMLVGLHDGWAEADADDTIRSIVLTGAGGAFCAGMDLKALAGDGMAGEGYRDRLKADPDLHWKAMLRHHRPRKPVIAAVEGHCVAGGTEILQGTDIRVAGESAVFGLFEVRRGLFQPPGSARIAGDRLHPRQHRLVEGLAVRLGHVVGQLDEGHDAQGDDEQGGHRRDFRTGDPQHSPQEGEGLVRCHRSLTVPLVRPFRSRVRDSAAAFVVTPASRPVHRLIPRLEPDSDRK